MNPLNILYCFDENYNYQALTSMISLLDFISQPINIFIIHSDETFLNFIPSDILNHVNLNNISVYQFKDSDYNFPNTKDVHITEATYYRIFISNYLPEYVENIIFLDCDVICLVDPIEYFKLEIEKLTKSNFILSARTEHKKEIDEINNAIYKRLDMNGPYFNAGVMIIDYKKWKRENIQNKLINKMIEYKDQIYQWDQDVLNSLFDGKYIELDMSYNFPASKINSTNDNLNPIILAHFLGSKKPWNTSGVFNYSSELYHSNYRKIFSDHYHIVHNWKIASLKEFIIATLSLKFFKLNRPTIYLKEFLLSFIK